MKRIIAVIIALIMAASAVPAAIAREVGAEDISVTYTGSVVDATALNPGDQFYFYVSVSEGSSMWSGHWLIDYPEEYVTPTSSSTTWSGGLEYAVQQTYNSGNPTSDKPKFVCELSYEGMTGSNPYGEEGNLYTVVGMYLRTFDYGGLQMGGNFVRIRYRLNSIPDAADLMHDANGYYFEIPRTVRESRYWVPGAEIGVGEYNHDHENITVINGKVYVNVGNTHTVTFYDINGSVVSTQTVEDGGAATAPTLDRVVMQENGPYIFYGWDVEFDNVTEDIEVHPLYTLVGDVTFDGRVDSEDALITLRGSLGIVELSARQQAAADIDFSGDVRSDDALRILRLALGIIDSLL